MSYSQFSKLKIIQGSSQQIVTPEIIKNRLRLDDVSQIEDDDIQMMIDAAINLIDGPHGEGVGVLDHTYEFGLDCFPDIIFLPITPVQQVVSIKYMLDGQDLLLSDSLYDFDPHRPLPAIIPKNGSFPLCDVAARSVRVEFLSGYPIGEHPKHLIQAIIATVGHFYKYRETLSLPESVYSILDRFRVRPIL